MTLRNSILTVAAATGLAVTAGAAHAGETLDAVKAKGFVQCGVSEGNVTGFSAVDSQGNWTGIDVAMCQAAAAAVFGDATAVRYTPTTTQNRFTALQSGEIDMLARNTTWTLTRDTSLGLNFAGVNFYDGQGFMVPASLGVESALELDGASVCIQPGTTTELNVSDYFRANGMSFEPILIESRAQVVATFFAGGCDVYTTDSSGLAADRASSAPNPADWVILPEIISKEPLGPVVAHGDDEWFDIVKWSLNAMIEAEEKGVTSANVDEMLDSTDPGIQRLLGVTPGMGEALGIPENWAYNIISQVGNYGEVYQAEIVEKLGVQRGVNEQWSKGGILYAAPVR